MVKEQNVLPRILLLGSSGQVGFELHRCFALQGKVIAPKRSQLDVSDLAAVSNFIDKVQPSLILNAAAWTAVDKAEEFSQDAKKLNALLPKILAEKAIEKGCFLIHFSTDYVYPGDGKKARAEDSPTGPLSVYGSTKLEGDDAITLSGCRHIIFRTSWVYSARGNNFMKTMLRLGSERDSLAIVSDQVGAPTSARLIAEVALESWKKGLDSGVYHLSAKGEASWYEFAQQVFRLAQSAGVKLKLDVSSVKPVDTSSYPTAAKRPLNSRLSVEKLEAALGCSLPDWKSQLQLTFDEVIYN